MKPWLILTATLPTSPSGLRVRIWRALKATHCATLREGVYLLPSSAPSASEFWRLDGAIREAGAQAHLLELQARDQAQDDSFKALFDRSELYSEFKQSLKAAHASLEAASETEARKTLRKLDQQLQDLLASDFFPGPVAQAAQTGLQTLRLAAERLRSPGEPATGQPIAHPLPRLALSDYQGRIWATRQRPWVDRLASAWLVQRFIDRSPTFLWLEDPAQCPEAALGFDFDGAAFTHVVTHAIAGTGAHTDTSTCEQVSFEVLAASFGLDADPALRRLGALVHCIDVGGLPVDEAPGVELAVRGLQALHADDDALHAAANTYFDTLYAALRQPP